MSATLPHLGPPQAVNPAALTPPDRELTVSFDIAASPRVIVSQRADLVAWCAEAWRRFEELHAGQRAEGFALRAIARMRIDRDRRAEGMVTVTITTHWMSADKALEIGEARARQQFWSHVETALFDLRADEALGRRSGGGA